MGPRLIKLITKNHLSTKRNYTARMILSKPNEMKISKKYDFNYWDGNRKFGYGGYYDDGRWKLVAKKIIKKYKLNSQSKVLDIGCGKGYLVKELALALNSKNIYGLDISNYAIKNSPKLIKNNIKCFDARKDFKYNKKFDLVISINLIHNFEVKDVFKFLKKILSISKKTYFATESYRNEKELFNLQCWALTCESFFSDKEWRWILTQCNYNRDYELIYFT
jgi:2-polyprenyl-3-methyl-5-hydroxy-6-metoxy-1,4-benzoquinol methylase